MNVFALTFATMLLLLTVGCDPGTSTPSVQEKESHDGRTLYLFVCNLVKNRLKAPATAKFADMYDSAVSYEHRSDNTWVIAGYVDAQNSFSAMIRTKFRAVAQFTPDGGAEALCLVFGEDIIGDVTAFVSPERKAAIAKEKMENEAAVAKGTMENDAAIAKAQAEGKAQDLQIAADRLAEEQRVEREKEAAAERKRAAAAWVFPRVVTTTAPIQIKLSYGAATIPAGTKVNATEGRQGMVRIEYGGSSVFVSPVTVGLPLQR